MTDHDLTAFADTFTGLRRVFPLRGDADEIRQIMAMYFKTLRRYPLAVVQAGADVCLRHGDRFPKPGDWLKALPKRETVELPELSHDDAEEHARALKLHYQDEPCRCVLCKAAGVEHRMLRFVPDTDNDGRDVRVLYRGQVTTRGHWAHGDELARWYAARDRYLALEAVYGKPKTIGALTAGDPRVDRRGAKTDTRTLADILIANQEKKIAALEAHPPEPPPLEAPPDVDGSDLFDEPFEEAEL